MSTISVGTDLLFIELDLKPLFCDTVSLGKCGVQSLVEEHGNSYLVC
jgi:hypothetical protein